MRRTVVAGMAAALTVLVASRVNRPVAPGATLFGRPGVIHEVLPEVRMDAASLTALVASINAAVNRPRVRLDATGLKADDLALHASDARPGHWRDVRIGQVLATEARRAFRDGAIEWHEQDGMVVVGRPGPLECRIYDVRDFAEMKARVEPPPENRGGGGGTFFGAIRGPWAPPTMDEEVAYLVEETVDATSWDRAGGQWMCRPFGGRLFVRASASGHRGVETLLMLLRQPEPAVDGASGGGR